MELGNLPLPALLDASWLLTLAIALRYCQVSTTVVRQYPYLHALESKISPEFGGGIIYRREGEVYLEEYPVFLRTVGFTYFILFPLLAVAAVVGLLWVELTELPYPLPHKVADGIMAATIVAAFILYRIPRKVTQNLRAQRDASRRRMETAESE